MDLIEIAEDLKRNPPDFEKWYGAGTAGEKIAQTVWLQALNSLIARAAKEETKPTVTEEGSHDGQHPSQRSTD